MNAFRFSHSLTLCFALVAASALWSRADEIDMINGDRYQGKIISMTSNEVVLNSEMLGLVKVPRAKVSGIIVGTPAVSAPSTTAVTASPALASSTPVAKSILSSSIPKTNAAPALNVSELQTNADLMKQVQAKYLAEAGPEATAKYNEMLKDLFSGKMTIGDLRNQAKSAADQLRSYKKDLGSEAGSELDEYLAILDKFVNEASGDDAKAIAPATPAKKPATPNQ